MIRGLLSAAIQQGSKLNSWESANLVLFYGLYSEISSGKMPNKVSGATDYLTVSGSAGSETYQAPNTSSYKDADDDNIWFNIDASQRTVTTAELIGYDFARTIIKYANDSPYAIESIMILKDGATLTTAQENIMRDDFDLSVWWSNVLSVYGNVKGNRGIGQAAWIKDVMVPTGLTLTGISGGVKIDWTDTNNGTVQTEIYGQSDGADYALLYTINAGIVTKSETVTPVDLRYYKIRAKNGTKYSGYTLPASIALLGAEKINQSNWAKSSYWNTIGAGWSANDTVLTSNGSAGLIQKNTFWTGNKTYKTVITLTGTGLVAPPYGGANGQSVSAPGVKTQTMVASSNNMLMYSSSFNGTVTAMSIKEVLYP